MNAAVYRISEQENGERQLWRHLLPRRHGGTCRASSTSFDEKVYVAFRSILPPSHGSEDGRANYTVLL